jgi:hypothetical protein
VLRSDYGGYLFPDLEVSPCGIHRNVCGIAALPA